MPNQFWIYTTPPNAIVQLIADNGVSVLGIPTPHEGRNDAQCIEVPFDTSGMGCALHISFDGYQSFEGRALLIADDGMAYLNMDDFHLNPIAVNPPTTSPKPPSYSGSPEEIINQVYLKTDADLSSHDGCGKFTEDACTALHDSLSQWWGHIRKNPGQNQYNSHAVDAIMLATGEGAGIYDIIHDSVSPNASPAYNWKGPPDLNLWYYPAAPISMGFKIVKKPSKKKK